MLFVPSYGITIAKPAEDKSGSAIKVVKQVQRERENCECQTFVMIEETVEFVIEDRNHSEQYKD